MFVARTFFPPMADSLSRLLESTGDEGFDPVDVVVVLLGIPAVVTAVWILRSVVMLVAAVPDLFVTREVEGVVLRIRRHEKESYVALDDGTGPKIRAWLVGPALLDRAGLGQGSAARAVVRPRLGQSSSWVDYRPPVKPAEVLLRAAPPGQWQRRLFAQKTSTRKRPGVSSHPT